MQGIRLSQLTEEVFLEILKLYFETVGDKHYPVEHRLQWLKCSLENVSRTLQNGHSDEWRLGSRMSMHSKLWCWQEKTLPDGDRIISFAFDPNIDYLTRKDEKEAKRLQRAFEKAVDNYLKKKGLAAPPQSQ